MPNASRDKGNRAERDVVAALASVGIDSHRLGEQTSRRGSLGDRGDVHAGPLCIQVKDWTGRPGSPPKTIGPRALAAIMAEAAEQCARAGLPLWLLIEKRRGYASALDWWVWMTHANYLRLTAPGPHVDFAPVHFVRVRLVDLVVPMHLLIQRGHLL